MKKVLVILGIIFVSVIGFSYHFRDRITYELNLPNEVVSISVNDNLITDKEIIKDILFVIKDIKRLTNEESISDFPNNVDNVITVKFNDKDVIYVYMKNNKCYYEQPYNGVYRVSYDEYNVIYKYIK